MTFKPSPQCNSKQNHKRICEKDDGTLKDSRWEYHMRRKFKDVLRVDLRVHELI